MVSGAELAILGAVPIPLVLIRPDGQVAGMNADAEAQFGTKAVGRHYITVLRQPVLLDCVEAALDRGQVQTATYPARIAEQDTTYQITATPVKDGRGVVLTLEDVSHVQAAGEMRRDFVANVSHELRTPLTALLGFIETLQGPARNDEKARTRFLGIMGREAQRMSRLIQDLLSLSRVEEGERLRPTGRADVAAILRSIRATLGPMGQDKGTVLTLTGAEASIPVQGDADQLSQVFYNLVENAIKYGGSAVDVRIETEAHNVELRAPAVRIVVADNGPGIDALHLPRLTERFYRVDNHRSREMGGTGLGLAIVKHIVGRHRGRMRIESETNPGSGQGTRFTVILPAT